MPWDRPTPCLCRFKLSHPVYFRDNCCKPEKGSSVEKFSLLRSARGLLTTRHASLYDMPGGRRDFETNSEDLSCAARAHKNVPNLDVRNAQGPSNGGGTGTHHPVRSVWGCIQSISRRQQFRQRPQGRTA